MSTYGDWGSDGNGDGGRRSFGYGGNSSDVGGGNNSSYQSHDYASTGTVRIGDSEYIRLSERVTSNVYQISNNVASLTRMVNLLGTKKDTHDLREKLHRVQDSTRMLAKETSANIKQLPRSGGGTAGEKRNRKMQQQKLSTDFQEVLKKFEQISKAAAQKERDNLVKARRSMSISHDDPYYNNYSNNDAESEGLLESSQQQLQQVQGQAEFNEALIAEREEGIREIESTIIEVNEIFRDLGTLVQEQGVVLDHIESNVESGAGNVERGIDELTKASSYQRKARRKMCCILGILLVVLVVISLVLVFTLKKKKK